MHDGEIAVTAADVRRLVTAQFPQWAELPVTPVAEAGTDHLLFRLGDKLVARMPKIGWAAEQAARDARWLPVLAPALPLTVPAPVGLGAPDLGYPFAWSVAPWIPGRPAGDPLAGEPLGFDAVKGAVALAGFVRALRGIDTGEGPRKTGTSRGVPLSRLDASVRAAIAEAGSRVDADAATRAWERALTAAPSGIETWIHADLLPGNLLAHGGRLSAVIDWGALGVGDPALDLTPTWTQFTGAAREVFREAAVEGLPHPEAALERARGWVIAAALFAIPYYWERWPAFAQASLRRLGQVT